MKNSWSFKTNSDRSKIFKNFIKCEKKSAIQAAFLRRTSPRTALTWMTLVRSRQSMQLVRKMPFCTCRSCPFSGGFTKNACFCRSGSIRSISTLSRSHCMCLVSAWKSNATNWMLGWPASLMASRTTAPTSSSLPWWLTSVMTVWSPYKTICSWKWALRAKRWSCSTFTFGLGRYLQKKQKKIIFNLKNSKWIQKKYEKEW